MHLSAANHFILDIPRVEDFQARHFKDVVDLLLGTLLMSEIDFPRYSPLQKKTYPDGNALVAVTNNWGLSEIISEWAEAQYYDPRKEDEFKLPGEVTFFYRTRVCYQPQYYISSLGSEAHLCL